MSWNTSCGVAGQFIASRVDVDELHNTESACRSAVIAGATDTQDDEADAAFAVDLEGMLVSDDEDADFLASCSTSMDAQDDVVEESDAEVKQMVASPQESTSGTGSNAGVLTLSDVGVTVTLDDLRNLLHGTVLSHGSPVDSSAGASDQRLVVAPSKSIGVTHHKKNKKWEAHLWLKTRQLCNNNKRKKKGMQLFLGQFATEDEAKRAHDRAALKLEVGASARTGKPYPLNFPESEHASYMAEHSAWSARDFLWKVRRSSQHFSKGKSLMKGVTVRTRSRKGVETVTFEAKISRTVHQVGSIKKTVNLGIFASEEEAGRAYDVALLFLEKGADELTTITNFRPSDYSEAAVQEAGRKLML